MPARTARNAKNSVVLNDALVSVSRRGAGRWALCRPSPSAASGRVAPGVVLMWVVLLYEGSDGQIRSVVTAQQCQTVPNARSPRRQAAVNARQDAMAKRRGPSVAPRIQSAYP